MIFFYIFAMLALTIFETYSQLDEPHLQYEGKFRSIQMSLATLFQVFTLDQWYSIEREMQQYTPFATLFFFVWIFVGAFIFQNIFVGVMVRNFQEINLELEKLDKERKRKRKEKRAMAKLQKQASRVCSHFIPRVTRCNRLRKGSKVASMTRTQTFEKRKTAK